MTNQTNLAEIKTADLTTITDRAVELTSLPNWLAGKLPLLRDIRNGLAIPAGQQLTSSEERWMRERIRSLQISLEEPANFSVTIQMVGDFLLAYSSLNLSKQQAHARAHAFWAALDDFPPWCVAEAIRRWHRGTLLQHHAERVNYAFPTPADLRTAAMDVKLAMAGRISVMERLLAANQRPEHSPEHRASMMQRFTSLIASLGRRS